MLGQPTTGSSKGILLGDLTWLEAEKVLTPETIVVIPWEQHRKSMDLISY
jgi:hypothetical protein